MDLMTLNAQNQASKLIENYDSLIWTERFNTVGDFQITTGNVEKFLQLLPEGTRLTLRESNIAMKVETHQIERKKNQPQKLTIKGRSFESILDQRISIQSASSLTGTTDWSVSAPMPSDVAYYITKAICVDGAVSAADIFETAVVQFPTPPDYLTSGAPNKVFKVPRGNLLTTVLGLLQVESPGTYPIVPHGIRAVRPNAAGTAIGIEIYTGVDRSTTVYFDATRELLDDGTYLFSKVGSANAAYGIAPGIAATMFEGGAEPTGLARRVTLVDGSTSDVSTVESLQNYMSQSLAEASETAIFDGSINPDLNPYKFGVHYNLGDIVRVAGDYGLNQLARVTEYIRSEDATGTKSYPTLETIVA